VAEEDGGTPAVSYSPRNGWLSGRDRRGCCSGSSGEGVARQCRTLWSSVEVPGRALTRRWLGVRKCRCRDRSQHSTVTVHGSAPFRVLSVKTEVELDALQVLSSQVAVRLRGVQGQRGTKRGEPHDRAKADKEERAASGQQVGACACCVRGFCRKSTWKERSARARTVSLRNRREVEQKHRERRRESI
jgi:hypothetical protein